MRRAVLALFLTASPIVAAAQPAPEPFWPGAQYDPKIPTLQQVIGHAPGEEITSPEQVATYLRALNQAAPDRTRLVEYARSWEGRPLWLFVVGNPQRIGALDQVKADIKRLADPRGLAAADADRLVGTLPVVVWLVHGVHGNEISSSDAALLEAYHLLAARGDAGVDAVFRDALVLIDPMQNPDGRARFLFQNLQGRAAQPDPAPYNAEHDEPWPGGRLESLPVRHEPRLVRADPARDPRPHPRRRSTTSRRSTSTCTSRAATTPTTSRRRPIRSTRTTPRRRSPASICSAAPTPPASTSAAGRTTSARSTTASIPATATAGRCSTARSA